MLLRIRMLLAFGMLVPGLLVAQQSVAVAGQTTDVARRAEELLSRPVTVNLRHVSRKQAIDAAAASAKVSVQYWTRVISVYHDSVTVQLTGVPLRVAFEKILAGTTLRVVPDGATRLAIIESEGRKTTALGGTIVGRVTDSASGRGLGGATVRVQGTSLAVTTSDSGQFTLRGAPAGDQVLTVRLFGHHPVTRTVTVTENGETSVRIVMTPTATVLGGMVTTATGTQRKLEVGNDITTLNVDSIMRVAPITSVTDLLESRVPGLTVLRSSGTPGDPARLRLRGAGSITGNNDPIVVVDGIRVYAAQSYARTGNTASSAVAARTVIAGVNNNVVYAAPSPLDQIDPNSIETIDVLKGPSASSLYGSDAANGVIVITTKRGRAGPPSWSTTINQGVSYYPGDFPTQFLRWGGNRADGSVSALLSEAFGSRLCSIVEPGCTYVDSVTHFQVLNQPRWSPVGHGNTTTGSATVSGGVSAMTYALTGSAGSNLGFARLPDALADAFQEVHGYSAPGWAKRPDRYTTWGGSGQVSSQVIPTLRVTVQSNLFHSLQQRSSLAQQLPEFLAATDTIQCLAGQSCGASSSLRFLNAYERASNEQLTFNNALNVSWAPWAWLPLTSTVGINTATGHDVTLLPRGIVLGSTQTGGKDTLGHYGVGQKSSSVKTLNVNTTIPGLRGRLNTAFGVQAYSQSTSDVRAEGDTLQVGVNTPERLLTGTQNVTGTTTYGWFFEPRFTLSQRFFLTPGFRLDGGNANGQNAGVSGLPSKLSFAALFPKVNFSWVALDRQEGDAPPLFGVLTLVRPRLALGSAGVQPTPGDRLRLLGSRSVNSSVDTLVLRTLGNTQLKPERSTEVEGGVDLEAWHNRANLQLTISQKMQHDAIIAIPLAPSIYGFGQEVKVNVGEVRNTNTELAASVTPIENALVRWTVGGNFSHNNSEVLRLDPRTEALANAGFDITGARVAVGYPLFGRWAKPILGYGDENGDGIIQKREILLGDTAVYLGRENPGVTAALNTDLSLFHGRLGVHANFSHQGAYSQLNKGSGSDQTFLSAANDSNATFGQQAAYVAASSDFGNPLTNIGLAQTVSYWRFESLSLNYNVPTVIAQRFRVPRMSVALQGSNLKLWSNYRGKDPDVNAFPNGNQTTDGGQLPRPRTWSVQFTLGN